MSKGINLNDFIQDQEKVSKIVSRKLISNLLKFGSISDIESGIVRYFLKRNNIEKIKNKLILDLTNNDSSDRVVWFLQKSDININLLDIEKMFELLISPEDKRINGTVYTPPFIVNYVVEKTIKGNGNVCDCSCGSGAFLLGALKRLMKLSNKSIIKIIEDNLYGVDIIDYSIRRAKIILSLFAIYNKEDKENINFNLKVIDSLETDWQKLFPDVFNKNGGFDYVVGNPPYVRIQDLKEGLKEKLIAKWDTINVGNFNLYFAFFELGMKILNNEGKLGYITPNNYFTSLAGVELREWFSNNKKIKRILNFNHLKIFENASTYTCITLMEKDYNNDYFEYCYVEDRKLLDSGITNIKFSHYFYEWLDNKKWRLMTEEDYYNVRKIESIGTQLGELCDIKVGIATLKDIVYFVIDYNSKYCKTTFNAKEYLIEKGITRKIVKIPSINNEEDIILDKRRIIFPYLKENGAYKVMSEKYFKERFPKCYEYLLIAKDELKKRDKGKKSYPIWLAWGRTQGMDYKGKRLYTRTFYHKPDFMLDKGEDNLFCNGYAVFCKKNIKAIQKILNSKVMEFYIKKTSVEIEGNYQCYQKNFIEKFNIPFLTDKEWSYLENEDNKTKIDDWLIKKYKLNI